MPVMFPPHRSCAGTRKQVVELVACVRRRRQGSLCSRSLQSRDRNETCYRCSDVCHEGHGTSKKHRPWSRSLSRGASIGGRAELAHPPLPTLMSESLSTMPPLECEELCFSTSSVCWQPLQNSLGQLSASMDTRRGPLPGSRGTLSPTESGNFISVSRPTDFQTLPKQCL